MMYEFCCKFPSEDLIPFLKSLDIEVNGRVFTEDWDYLTIEYDEFDESLLYVGFVENLLINEDITMYEVSVENFMKFLESVEAYGYDVAKTMYKEEFTLNGKLLHE